MVTTKYKQNHILRGITTLKIYEKIAIILKFGTELNSILHASAAHGTLS